MVLDEVLHQNLAGFFSHSQDGAAAHPKLILKCQNLYKFRHKIRNFHQLSFNLFELITS